MSSINYKDLVPDVMSYEALKKLCQRGKVRRVVMGGNGRGAMYDVESLPVRYRREVYRRYPDLAERQRSEGLMDLIEPNAAAEHYFATYLLGEPTTEEAPAGGQSEERKSGRHLPVAKQREYANNCAILDAIDRQLEKLTRGEGVKKSKTEFWTEMAESMPRLKERYPNSLPENARSLQRKYALYKREGFGSMIHKLYQNTNATKILTEEQDAVLLVLVTQYNNLEDTRIASLYNSIAASQSPCWSTITASTVRNWRKSHPQETAYGRLGATKFKASKSMQVRRSKPTAPFLHWSLDGWTAELLYQRRTERKSGTVVTYHNRLTMVVVLDTSCDYPMGYAIGDHETPELIKEALRNAALHSRELTGEMLRACQIQSDRYAIKKMSELYSKAGQWVTPAAARNAKAKPIERYFGYLNNRYCKVLHNWAGYGITTDPNKQPNSEAKNALRHCFPDEAGCRQQLVEIIEAERAQKRAELLELLTRLPDKYRLPMTRADYLLAYGETTSRTIQLEGCGVRPQLLGVRRAYDTFDPTFREHADADWSVYYDPDDLSNILVTTEGDTRRYLLDEKYVQPMALAEQSAADREELARVQAYNKAQRESVEERIMSAHELVHVALEENEVGKNILNRLMLLDSKGQHKDERSLINSQLGSGEEADFEEVDYDLFWK
ncbi:hypothetical protein [uncultured Porphyromonas sp.]|jgi:hypothetical protein|uniref:hypothetical protein n=1 Tax=uncultured Porphyromonas sp. TaxID=159274 RepID=UPI002607DAE5|nr:hypothetical protein [uncultured Porphyromonas sp.]